MQRRRPHSYEESKVDSMSEDRIDLTPENFCYLSKCRFFISNIESTGCRIDYMHDKKRKE